MAILSRWRLLAAAVLIHVGPALAEPGAPLTLAQAKAGFVYNLALFAEWPAEASSGDLVIGVLGDEALYDELRRLSGRQVNGRTVRITRLVERNDPHVCHILFVGAELWAAPRRPRLDGAPVLTIGDAPDFTADGGMIRVFVEQARLRYEINITRVQEVGLRLSSKLLSLAKLAKDDHAQAR